MALHARSRPDHVALIDGERSLTHAELHRRVGSLAVALLSGKRLRRGDIVGLCLRDHLEHVLCLWACARAGLVMLPLDWRWTATERDSVLRHFNARCVIAEADLPVTACPVSTWQEIHADEADPDAGRLPATSLQSPLLLSLSSGTTGRPKGPMITHGHFLRRFWTHWINLGLNANSRFVCATPLYFGGGRTFTLSVIFSGGTAILHSPPFEPEALAAVVEQHDANALFLVPTQLRRLLACASEVREPLRRLQLLVSSGSPLQANERQAIRDRLCERLHEYYASTEGGGISLCTPRDVETHPTSVGRAIYGVDVGIVDELHRPLGPRQVGLLRYRGPGVAEAFFNDPEQSRLHFRDGWFYPGDLAEQDAQGYIYLRGRAKDTIIRGGINIYPSEIEDTLLQLPKLRECCVLGIPDTDLGELLACAWVGKDDLTSAQLEAHCRTALASYKLPSVWLRLSELPRNSAGKVVKDRLQASCRQAAAAEFSDPSAPRRRSS